MKINIIKFKKDDKNKMKGKIKRKEWLNLYSKGFFVESINNDYENQDIVINRKFKNNNNNLFNPIRKKNFNYIFSYSLLTIININFYVDIKTFKIMKKSNTKKYLIICN